MTTTNIKPGDRITWTHYATPGAGWVPPFTREGTVWAGAPAGNSLVNAWWVHPDTLLDGEETAGGVVAIGRAAGQHIERDRRGETGGPAKGEVYGSSYWIMQPAALTSAAARVQHGYAARAAA